MVGENSRAGSKQTANRTGPAPSRAASNLTHACPSDATTHARSRPGGRPSGPTNTPGRSPTAPEGRRRPASRRHTPRQVLRARDAALPERRAPHRPPQELHDRRRDRPLPPPHRPPRAAPDGLRRVRPAGREQRDQDGRAPARRHRRVDRRVPEGVPLVGDLDRLVARDRHPRARVLPLDPVDLPAAVQARPRLPQGVGRQLVPERPDRARQRAGDRRPLRALRPRGRAAPARAVVLPDHRLRRPPARRPRHDRLARARQDDAAQLDRPQRRRRGQLPLRGAGDRLPGLHDPSGHAVRRDLLRDGARAPRRLQARRRHARRAGGAPATSTTR